MAIIRRSGQCNSIDLDISASGGEIGGISENGIEAAIWPYSEEKAY